MIVRINQINFKDEYPSVRFQSDNGEAITDSTFPGKGSDPVLPRSSFANAIDAVAALLQSVHLLPVEYTLRLNSITLLWDAKTGEYGYRAGFSGFLMDVGSIAITVEQKSADHVDPILKDKLADMVDEAIGFVKGASAQGNLLELKEVA